MPSSDCCQKKAKTQAAIINHTITGLRLVAFSSKSGKKNMILSEGDQQLQSNAPKQQRQTTFINRHLSHGAVARRVIVIIPNGNWDSS
jgi:hypothetical protein